MQTTPANVNDAKSADDLIRGDEAVVWADAAFDTHARRARPSAEGKKPRIARRPNRHPELPPTHESCNRLIARRRAKVEDAFATRKCRIQLTCIRYVGLIKANGQIPLASIAFNVRRAAAIAA